MKAWKSSFPTNPEPHGAENVTFRLSHGDEILTVSFIGMSYARQRETKLLHLHYCEDGVTITVATYM